jgi:hypothetical protein
MRSYRNGITGALATLPRNTSFPCKIRSEGKKGVLSLQLGSCQKIKCDEEGATGVKTYVSTGRTFTTRNLAARCTGTAMKTRLTVVGHESNCKMSRWDVGE